MFALHVAVFAGGLLTLFSPCILPVLPFVFLRAGESFMRRTLPMLVGLVLAFVLVATIGAAGALWVASAADAARVIALFVLGVAGLTLMSRRLSSAIARPLVAAGARMSARADRRASGTSSIAPSIVIGMATGLLWSPCAGPILALITAGTAAGGRPALAISLFVTFGAGAATALAIGILAGGRLMRGFSRFHANGVGRWARRALGAAAVAAALLIAMGWDASLFASRGVVQTAHAEEAVLRHFVGNRDRIAAVFDKPAEPRIPTPDEGPLPSFDGATGWINSPEGGSALVPAKLRGKVVVVNVWTFACYNCLNALPHVKELAAKYRSQDVVVIGVHTPELARERVPSNVAEAVQRLGVTYPVALDANYTIWRAFKNEYWPSLYIADKKGHIRFHQFGEGRYEDEDKVVAQLLSEP